MHVLTSTTKTSKQTPCSCRDRNESVVSFGYTWPVMGPKAHRPSLRPPDRSRNPYKSPPDRSRNPYKSPPDRIRTPYKSPPTIFSLYLSDVAIRADYTWASPSHHLFADFHRSSPLGRIQHHTKRQRCLPVSYSAPREMAEFVSSS